MRRSSWPTGSGSTAVGCFSRTVIATPGPCWSGALEVYGRLIREGSSVPGSASGPERYLRGRAACSYLIACCFTYMGMGTEALGCFERAIADYEELTHQLPGDVDLWLALADCHGMMCECLGFNIDRSQGRQRRAFHRAEAIYERLAREYPTVTRVRFWWAQLLTDNAGRLSGELKGQLESQKLGVQLYREAIASDPDVPRVAVGLRGALSVYGFGLWQAGQTSEGMRLLRESAEFFESRDYSEFSYGDGTGAFARLGSAALLAVALGLSGQAEEGLEVVGRSLGVGERIIARHDSRIVRYRFVQNLVLHSYLAFNVGRPADAAGSVERAAAILEPMNPSAEATWLLGVIQMLWYLQGRAPAIGRSAEPPGRPEHAAESISLVRRAAERGYVDVNLTAAFFGPVLGHLPEFRRLMEDLKFPADPFRPEPGSESPLAHP